MSAFKFWPFKKNSNLSQIPKAGEVLLFVDDSGILKTRNPDGSSTAVADGTGLPDAPSDTKQYARKDGAWVEVVGGGSYILKSASFTAEIGKAYSLDTTSGSFDVTLPESPAGGKTVCFCDARGTWNTHPPTFLRNGNKIEGQEINFTDSAQGTFFCMVFIDAATGWRILESGTKPQNLIVPEITGHYVGVAFTSTNGSWTGTPTTFSYQWQLSADGSTGWADIEGATGATYTPVSLDETKFVRVLVTATNANGSSLPATSLASVEIEVLPFPAGAVAHWRLNETSGVRVDATGNEYDLTDNNSVGYAAGKLGNAAAFDLTSKYLSSSVSGGNTETGFSVSLWVKSDGTNNTVPISATGENYGWFMALNNDSNIYFLLGTNSWTTFETIKTPYSDEWYHLVFTVDSNGDGAVYCDGVSVITLSGVSWPGYDLRIGQNTQDSTLYNGSVDSVSVWHRALSGPEVAMLYNSGNGLDYPA